MRETLQNNDGGVVKIGLGTLIFGLWFLSPNHKFKHKVQKAKNKDQSSKTKAQSLQSPSAF